MISVNIETKRTDEDVQKNIDPTRPDDDPGDQFWEWIKAALSEDGFPINQQGALVHTVPEGLFLVSPAIFKHFDGENWAYTQKRFQKLKLHERNADGTNIHTYLVRGKRRGKRKKSGLLKGFLIRSAQDVFGTELPRPNKALVQA
jgi:hypothetical protein